mmetsp:Transcript_2141/g.3168  ORF Transcript_2141/g.3168 Transcript_2141/m.3168 type:complete len:343 (-) Transcript_2141:1670-2698(-)
MVFSSFYFILESILVLGLVRCCPGRITKNVIGEWEEDTGFYQALRVTDDSPIFKKQSKYQSIEVHKSEYFGKILVLDGVLQLTEEDADSYNEMMAHMPMMQHKNPKTALVIGGGDGYVLNEILKHPSLEHVDHVDLDGDVVEVCKEYFKWGAAWDDPRVTLHVKDGSSFMKNVSDGFYDVIVQDSSDPWTWDKNGEMVKLPSGVLYTEDHFSQLYRGLSENGILNIQAETFHLPTDLDGIISWRKQALGLGFSRAQYGSIAISTYPTGQIGFLMCEKNSDAASTREEVDERFKLMQKKSLKTTYYQPKLQKSSLDLPLWVEKKVYYEVNYDDDETSPEREEL